MSESTPHNIADYLSQMAAKQPDKSALIIAENGKSYSYAELEHASNQLAQGLLARGVKAKMHVMLMTPPNWHFYVLVFALFKLGAVLIAIDPGIGISRLKRCVNEAEPDVFIGNFKAQFARILFAWGRKSIKQSIWAASIPNIMQAPKQTANFTSVMADDMAAILFTSGSTGAPKGVVYSHANFAAQVKLLGEQYQIKPGEIDLATFPLFGLFAPALGMTVVIPTMDFTRPGHVDADKILNSISRYQCTTMFASPALLKRILPRAKQIPQTLSSLKRILSAGAPVPVQTLSEFKPVLPDTTQIFTPYGATESLPVSSIGSNEIIEHTATLTAKGHGVCVGKPVTGLTVKIIPIDDRAITNWQDSDCLPCNEIGEIIVQGEQVSRYYFNRQADTTLGKITLNNDSFFHRMGDLGYFDQQGRLWFCGRKSQRLILPSMTLHTVCCEEIFNQHEDVLRSALVAVEQKAILCIELESNVKKSSTQIIEELLTLAKNYEQSRHVSKILVHQGFPVDIRHNAKINREQLQQWASKKLT